MSPPTRSPRRARASSPTQSVPASGSAAPVVAEAVAPFAAMPGVSVSAPVALSFAQRAQLNALAAHPLHAARNATKARVSRVEWPPGSRRRIVVKDGAARGWWFRVFVGRVQLAREWKALCHLNGMNGVPRPVFRAGADAFGMEWCGGEPLLRFSPGELSPRAVEQLEILLGELHERGVTHGDLHRDNILFDAHCGRVWLIDWATSCVFGPTRRGFKAWMWREWCALDRRALAKIKARYAPELLRADELDSLHGGGTPLSRLVRQVGSLFKRRARKTRPVSSPAPRAPV